MKIVKRTGVFETNSSSTHSIILVAKEDLEKNPKVEKHHKLTSKKDKLMMACGCFYEIYEDNSPYRDENQAYYDIDDELMKAFVTKTQTDPFADDYLTSDDLTCDTAIRLLVSVYCNLTGEDFDTVFNPIIEKNKSGRACHTLFFREGALYDTEFDYDLIDMLFVGPISKIIENIENYFDDGNVLCYLEYWQGSIPLYAHDDD